MATALKKSFGVFLPLERDISLAQEASRKLTTHFRPDEDTVIRLLKDDGETDTMVLPAAVMRLLLDILEQMARGNAMTLMPIPAELTTQQAADLLHVSRPHLIALLQQGKIPYRKVGTHRRVRAEDIVAYKQTIDAKRRDVLDELAAQAQELGLGY